MSSPSAEPSLTELLDRACVLEATARKPGNVHPQAAFVDTTYQDFVDSARLVAPVLATAGVRGVGRCVFDAVDRTRTALGRNTNLGIILLLAPLAAVPRKVPLRDGVDAVLQRLSVADAEWVYAAIRRAQPGGLGSTAEQDVQHPPTLPLGEIMRLAAPRDLIARQYATGYALLWEFSLPELIRRSAFAGDWEAAVVGTHLALLAAVPDSLIVRKCGPVIAAEAQTRARQVLDAGDLGTPTANQALDEFDRWLRADGHRRNPGTTADLIAATLFAGLRERLLPPWDIPRLF